MAWQEHISDRFAEDTKSGKRQGKQTKQKFLEEFQESEHAGNKSTVTQTNISCQDNTDTKSKSDFNEVFQKLRKIEKAVDDPYRTRILGNKISFYDTWECLRAKEVEFVMLKADKDKLQADWSNCVQAKLDLSKEITTIRTKNEEIKTQNHRDHQTLRDKCEKLQTSNFQQQSEISVLKAQLENFDSTKLKEELNNWKSEHYKITSGLKETIGNLNTENKELAQSNVSIEKTVREMKLENEKIKGQLADINLQLRLEKSTREKMQKDNEDLRQQNTSLHTSKADQENDIMKIREALEVRCKEIQVNKQKYEQLQNENRSIEKSNSLLRQKIHNETETIKQIRNEIQDIKIEKDKLILTNKENDSKKQELQIQHNQAKEANTHLQERIVNMQQEVVTLQEGNKALLLKLEPELYPEPWASLADWNEQTLKDLKEKIVQYSPSTLNPSRTINLPNVNILLLGTRGAGKSSFYNTVNSYFRGRVSMKAVSGSQSKGITKRFRKHPIMVQGSIRPLEFQLCDCLNFDYDDGILEKDIENIVEGHIPDGYFFNSTSAADKDNCPTYNNNPHLADQIHCVVFVVDAGQLTSDNDCIIAKNIQEKVKHLQDQWNIKGLPQFVLMNKVDLLCVEAERNLQDLYYSPIALKSVRKVAQAFGLPEYAVMPMQCIKSEQGSNIRTDIGNLALTNLQLMLNAADDYLEQLTASS